jgi:predicted deacylase
VRYPDYLDRLKSQANGWSWREYASVLELGRSFPLVELHWPGPNELLITSGFHGEEPAGPLTFMEHLPKVLELAKRFGIGVRIFPCVNPAGFELGTRYNPSGERPNNDFLRYELSPGQWVGELPQDSDQFLRYVLFGEGPKETRALRAELEKLPNPKAALDIHQDHYLERSLTYAYIFGEHAPYAAMMKKAESILPVAKRLQVDEHHRTDDDGLIVSHDGSVTDYFWRRGVRFTAALETTTHSPMESCQAVDLIWIEGFFELAASAGVATT